MTDQAPVQEAAPAAEPRRLERVSLIPAEINLTGAAAPQAPLSGDGHPGLPAEPVTTPSAPELPATTSGYAAIEEIDTEAAAAALDAAENEAAAGTAPAEPEAKKERIVVIGLDRWLEDHGYSGQNTFHMALRMLQGSLAHPKSKLAAVEGRFDGREGAIRLIFMDHELALSKKRAAAAWNEVVTASKEFARRLPKPLRKDYLKAVTLTEQIIGARDGVKTTFLFGFHDSTTETEGDGNSPGEIVHTFVVAMAAYQEPKPLLRGEVLEALSVDQFNYVFQSQGGRLVAVDPPKRIQERLGFAFRAAENYLDANHPVLPITQPQENDVVDQPAAAGAAVS